MIRSRWQYGALTCALAVGLVGLTIASQVHAFTRLMCNGSPVGLSSSALNLKYEATCSMTYDAQQAANNAIDYEIDGVITTAPLSHSTYTNNCTVTLNNGVNEVARASRSAVGGNGMTFQHITTCVLSSTTTENDVLVADDLEVTMPQDAWVGDNFPCRSLGPGSQNGRCDIGLGAFTFLHEFLHTINLQHNIGQVVMHNGPPVPYGGSGAGAASPATLFPDDADGVRTQFGTPSNLRNVMSSSSHMPSSETDALTHNTAFTTMTGWGVVYYLCPGYQFPFWTTSVNNGVSNETFNRRVFLTTSPWDINWSTGWVFGTFTGTTLNASAIGPSYATSPLPGGSVPRQTYLWMFHQVDTAGNVPGPRYYDNFSQYSFVISIGSVAQCGQ